MASLVAITAVWSMIFHPSKGPVNAILYYIFHVENLPNWFGGDLILLTLILFSVWKYMGYYMVIYLAGLQGISAELYEAAGLDGANTWQKFRYVTWPQLRSTTFFVTEAETENWERPPQYLFTIFTRKHLLNGILDIPARSPWFCLQWF